MFKSLKTLLAGVALVFLAALPQIASSAEANALTPDWPLGLVDDVIRPKGHSGVAVIGLEAFAKPDVVHLSQCLLEAGGTLEVAFLFASFNPADPWDAPTDLVKRTLPGLNGRLILTCYLDDGPNRRAKANRVIRYGPYFRPDLSPRLFWSLAGGPAKDRRVTEFYRDWNLKLVKRYRAGATALIKWARDNGLSHKLDLVVLPVLEDDAGGDSPSYGKLLRATQSGLQGLPVTYRRNGAARIVGLPLERHGLSGTGLRRGDVLTNDGSPTDPETFMRLQQILLVRGVSCCWWEAAYNGSPRSTPPSQRGQLRPFTGSGSVAQKKRDLIAILTARPN